MCHVPLGVVMARLNIVGRKIKLVKISSPPIIVNIFMLILWSIERKKNLALWCTHRTYTATPSIDSCQKHCFRNYSLFIIDGFVTQQQLGVTCTLKLIQINMEKSARTHWKILEAKNHHNPDTVSFLSVSTHRIKKKVRHTEIGNQQSVRC